MSVVRRSRVLLSVYYAYMMEYRAEILLWALSNVFPLIMMGIWMEVGRDGRYEIAPVDFARYFLAVFIVRQFTVVWVIWEMEYHIVEGKLSPYLLQPIDPVWRFFAGHVAERITRLPFSICFIVLFFVMFPSAYWVPHPAAAAVAVLFVVLTFLMRFIMQYTSSMLAFWVERASATEHLMWIFYLFLSGLMAPLELYDPTMRTIALYTPFPYLVWYPSRLLVSGFDGAGVSVSLAQALTVMAVWGFGYFVLNRWLWRLGLKHYSAMGA